MTVTSPHVPAANSIGALRYLLASIVLLHHCNSLAGTDLPLLLDVSTAVSAFFVLSGFFSVSGWQRCPQARGFILHRLRRLLPVYWVVVWVGAVGLVSVSSWSAADYFTSLHWWKYVVYNTLLLNFMEPTLPGVFQHHLSQAVNPALWYVKVEVGFALAFPLLVGLARRLSSLPFLKSQREGESFARFTLCSWLLLSLVLLAVQAEGRTFPRQAVLYLTYFQMYWGGVTLRQWYHRVGPFRRWAWAAVAVSLPAWFFPVWQTVIVLPLFIALLVRLFLTDSPLRCANRHNFSYSLYLCHSPLIQLALLWFSGLQAAAVACVLTVVVSYGGGKWVEFKSLKV